MGKATNPAKARRQRATEAVQRHGNVEHINGVDHNHGASPLTRWKAARELSDSQLAAIGWCQSLWALTGLEQRTTANYGERTSAATAEGEGGAMVLRRMRARDDLKRVSGGLGFDGEYDPGYIPKPYWDVFENCIRFDEPAGIAGSRLGRSAPSVRALTAVRFVADIIAMKERLQF